MDSKENYEILEIIGHGSFGSIKKVRSSTTGKICVRKEIQKSQIKDYINNEIFILERLKGHPRILEIFFTETDDNDYNINNEIHMYIEYCEFGTLYNYIREEKQIKEDIIWDVFGQIIEGILYCHFPTESYKYDFNDNYKKWGLQCINNNENYKNRDTFGILHRDIKSENILISAKHGKMISIKIADFGLARITNGIDNNNSNCLFLNATYAGTPYYMPPEVVLSQDEKVPYTMASDVWSLGCVLYELAMKITPFASANSYLHLCHLIQKGIYQPIPISNSINNNNGYSMELRDTIDSCLFLDGSKRPTVKDLIAHPKVKEARKERAFFEQSFALQKTQCLQQQTNSISYFEKVHGDENVAVKDYDYILNSPGDISMSYSPLSVKKPQSPNKLRRPLQDIYSTPLINRSKRCF